MAHRIEVGLKAGLVDAPGEKLRRRIHAELGIEGVEALRCIDVYLVDAPLTPEQLRDAASDPLCDPVIQQSCVDRPLDREGFSWAVEVGLKPGVTDNVGRTAAEALALTLNRPFSEGESVYHARQVRFWGDLNARTVERITNDLLANKLIHRFQILSAAEHTEQNGFALVVPKVSGKGREPMAQVDLELPDQALVDLSRERVLALGLDEMRCIRDYYRREDVQAQRLQEDLAAMPTDVELECLAQTWSEHCKHKIFNARIRYRFEDEPEQIIDSLFDTYIRGGTKQVRKDKGDADLCQSVFVDNAGVFHFDETDSLVCKVETHNSPSALDPYGGALTGIVGVNRDPFGTGQGARLIFNTDVFCLADPRRTEAVPSGLLHPRRVLEGVREGVEHGGNKSGIPTINGSVVFDERFLGKPLVFCGTGGLLPRELHGRDGWVKRCRSGDRIVMVGGRIGADGIHGATFSSEELHEGSPTTAVQIGDPITQKRMFDFLLVARDEGLYSAMTDNGAGGLSSSVGEMGTATGGCDLDLTKAPLKYEGLAAWEILVSEAQERMTLAVPPDKLPTLLALADRYQVEATDLGQFTDDGFFRVRDRGRTVALLTMDFLHDGLPPMELEARWQAVTPQKVAPVHVSDPTALLKEILGRLNICSKHYWVRQYDHEVQAGTVIKPLMGAKDDGPSDASVFRPKLGSMRAVAVGHGICPRYSDFDAGAMAAAAVDEALRNVVAVGGDPDRAVGLDNFCWCDPVLSPANPDGDFKLGQLVRANQALYEACTAYGVACISGKDSMKNDAVIDGERISIPPTLLFTCLALMDDAGLAVSMDCKQAGHLLYVLGRTRAELGGSEYLAQLGLSGGDVPGFRPAEHLGIYRALHQAMKKGLVASCHDCSDGGLAVAFAETAFAGALGLSLDLAMVPAASLVDDDLLYAESLGRFVVTVAPERAEAFERELGSLDGLWARVGQVTAAPRLQVASSRGGRMMDVDLEQLRRAWLAPLDW